MIRFVVPALLVASLGGCVDTTSENEREAGGDTFRLSQSMMPGYCRQQASERFDTNPGDITMGALESGDGMATVSGSTANGALAFTCAFTEEGEFLGLDLA